MGNSQTDYRTGKLTGRAMVYGETITAVTRRHRIRGAVVKFAPASRYLSYGVRLGDVTHLKKALELGDELAYAAGTQVVVATRQAGLLFYQFQLAYHLWKKVYRADLPRQSGVVPLGRGDGGRVVSFRFSPPHTGIFGATGAGKSETVKSLLAGLFAAYAPSDLRAVLIDPDGDLSDFAGVSHLAGSIARSAEEANQLLGAAEAEMKRRGRANQRDAGRLVVVVDEAEKVLADGTRLAWAQAIARGGRKWRVNLILATQDPSERTLPDLLPQLGQRLVGQVDSAQTSAHLTGHKALHCEKLSGEGDFMRVTGAEEDRVLIALTGEADIAGLPHGDMGNILDLEPEEPTPDQFEPDPPGWESEPGGPGRPPDDMSPAILARYLVYHAITQRQAKMAGLSKYKHLQYKGFAVKVIEEIKRLLAARKVGTGGR